MVHTAKLLDEYPLIVLPSLAKIVGLNESIVLQQIHFYINTKKRLKDSRTYRDGHYWQYNTFQEWQEEFSFWSLRTVKTIFSKLEKLGLLISEKFGKADWDHRKWYRINYEALNQVFSDSARSASSIVQTLHDQSGKICIIDSANSARSVGQDLHDHLKDQRLLTKTTYREKESTCSKTQIEITEDEIQQQEIETTPSINPPLQKESTNSTTHKPQDQFSAAPVLALKTSIQQCDERFQTEALPWQSTPSPNAIDQGFAEFVFQKVVLKSDYWRDKNPTIADAKQWIVKARYSQQRSDQSWLRWQEYQEYLQRPPKEPSRSATLIPDYLQGPDPDLSWLREKIQQAKKEGHPYVRAVTAKH